MAKRKPTKKPAAKPARKKSAAKKPPAKKAKALPAVANKPATGQMKIEKGLPIPDPPKRYPYKNMEIGDSFFIAGDNAGKNMYWVYVSASSAGKRLKRKFSARKCDGGMRVWRVT